MTYGEERAAVAKRSADAITKVASRLHNEIDLPMMNMVVQLSTTVRDIDTTMRILLVAIKETRDARADANSVVLGTTGMVADAIGFMNAIDADTEDDVKKLHFLKGEIEKLRDEVLKIAQQSTQRSSKKATAAAGLMNSYASIQ